MKRFTKNILLLIISVFFILYSCLSVSAGNPTTNILANVGKHAGYAQQPDAKATFATLIGQVVQAFLSFLGIIFLILILYGGYNWMTSAGDEQKITKAKDTIRSAIIGVIITAGAFGIWKFIAQFIL